MPLTTSIQDLSLLSSKGDGKVVATTMELNWVCPYTAIPTFLTSESFSICPILSLFLGFFLSNPVIIELRLEEYVSGIGLKSFCRMEVLIAGTESPSKGNSNVHISYSRTPNDHMSYAVVMTPFWRNSGLCEGSGYLE